MRFKLRLVVLCTTFVVSFILISPVILADAEQVIGYRVSELERRVTSVETIPARISNIETDVAVLKSNMGEVSWLLRGLVGLAFGVIVERVLQIKKSRSSIGV